MAPLAPSGWLARDVGLRQAEPQAAGRVRPEPGEHGDDDGLAGGDGQRLRRRSERDVESGGRHRPVVVADRAR